MSKIICIRWSYNHKYLDGFWHHKSSQETATGMMESCFMVQKNHGANFHLGDAYLISFLSKMRIVKPNRELWRLDIVMLVKRLAQCLACSKWLVYFASCCVWKHLVNADVGISVIVPRAQGGISQEGRQIWKTWGWTQWEKLIWDHLQMFFNCLGWIYTRKEACKKLLFFFKWETGGRWVWSASPEEHMVPAPLGGFPAKIVAMMVSIWKIKYNTQHLIKKQERRLVMHQMRQLSTSPEKIF